MRLTTPLRLGSKLRSALDTPPPTTGVPLSVTATCPTGEALTSTDGDAAALPRSLRFNLLSFAAEAKRPISERDEATAVTD